MRGGPDCCPGEDSPPNRLWANWGRPHSAWHHLGVGGPFRDTVSLDFASFPEICSLTYSK